MLFDYTYLLQNFNADFFSDKDIERVEYIIPVDEHLTGSSAAVFETLMNASNRFCFYLPPDLLQRDKIFINGIVQELVRLLFLPNYSRSDGKYIFFVKQPEETNSLINQFHGALKKQGIEIQVIEILAGITLLQGQPDKNIAVIHPRINHYLNNTENENNFETFIQGFDFQEYIDNKLIIPVASVCDLKNKIKSIAEFETSINIREPLKVILMEKYKNVLQRGNKLFAENKLLKFKLDNSASYLELIKKESANLLNHILVLRNENHRLKQSTATHNISFPELAAYADHPDFIILLQSQVEAQKKRADETLNWYLKEYEALPMWYKRGGQLLKVLTGKRTFKSLFKNKNDDQGRKST